ncbi:MAG: glycosyltransferase, partial [Xanthobacteraceae bacterium]
MRRLTIVVPVLNEAAIIVAALRALAPQRARGAEVIVADGGSRDDTAAVADVAGCKFSVVEGSLGRRLKTAAAAARAPWLLFLRPGTVLDAPWVGEARRFVEEPSPRASAATFRRGAPAQPA